MIFKKRRRIRLNKHTRFAIIKSNQLGEKLAEEHPEIVQMYRRVGIWEIARKCLRGEFRISERVAMRAVERALIILIPSKADRNRIVFERRRQELRQLGRQLGKSRWKEGNIMDLREAFKTRGVVAWDSGEVAMIYKLRASPPYKKSKRISTYGGRSYYRICLDYDKIADRLNQLFHEGRPVRTASACRYKICSATRDGIRQATRKVVLVI